MCSITIAPLAAVPSVMHRLQLSHAVSILGARDEATFPSIKAEHVLRLTFDDVRYTSEFGQAASAENISELISFARTWAGSGNLRIHCKAGTSRSAAAGMIALASISIPEPDEQIAKLLRLKNYFRPNSTMLRIADRLLEYRTTLLEMSRTCTRTQEQQKIGPATMPIKIQS